MATPDDVLGIEAGYLGEGGERFWSWYPAPAGTAWCCIFQSYCLTQAGIPTHFAWVSGLFDHYRSSGLFTSTNPQADAQPGDLVAFEWGSTPGGYDHIAMIVSTDRSGAWTRNGNVNGSRVRDLWFPWSGGGMAEIARPPYTSPTPTPTPPEDEEMKSVLLIDRRQSPAPVWHACGNTKVWLSAQPQVDILRFFGVPVVDPAPPAWVDALATLPRNDGKLG